MYGNLNNVVLPSTGSGAMAVAAATHEGWLLLSAIGILACWTLLMALRATMRLRPKLEE